MKNNSNRPRTEREIEEFKKAWASETIDDLKRKYKVVYSTLRAWAVEFKARRDKNTNRTIEESKLIRDSSKDIDISYEELIGLMKKENEALKKIIHQNIEINAKIETNIPILLVFSADWHLGDLGTDYDSFAKDIEVIKTTKNLYAYLGGDFMDNFIQNSKLSAVLNQEPILKQRKLAKEAIKRIKEKVIAIGTSCHMDWTNKEAGFDDLGEWARELNILYIGFGGLLNLTVGNQIYKIFRRHKFRFDSQFNLLHSAKQLLRMGITDSDILVLEHWHVPAKEEFYWAGQKRIALRTGTYKLTDSYALEHGFYGQMKACPSVILYPNEKRMLAFLDMYDAIDCLEGLNNNREKKNAISNKR